MHQLNALLKTCTNSKSAKSSTIFYLAIIIIKNTIPYIKTDLLNSLTIKAIELELENKLHIIAVYNILKNKFTIEDILSSVGDRTLIPVDLNASHLSWKNQINNTNGLTLYEYTKHNNIII